MAFGVSFLPQGGGNPGEQGQPTAVEPSQAAIKILSLRLPKVTGGSPFAPAPLLQAPGGMGNPLLRSGIGQTQQRVLPQLAAPPGPSGPVGPSVGGAPSPFAGGLPPGVIQDVLDILAKMPKPPMAPPRVIPGEEGRNPNPRPSDPGMPAPTTPTFTLPPPPAPAPPAQDFPRTPWGDFYGPDPGMYGTEG